METLPAHFCRLLFLVIGEMAFCALLMIAVAAVAFGLLIAARMGGLSWVSLRRALGVAHHISAAS